MFKYLLIIFILIILYLARNKIIEPMGPISIKQSDETQTKKNDNVNNIFITNNNIDYDKLDNNINNIIREHELLDYTINNFNFSVGYVDNNLYQNEEPTILIGGNYPKNIALNFSFPPSLPGKAGEKGKKGEKGQKGQKGPIGKRGSLGGNNYC